ncbi:MAG: GIY-YIG nuclease family protein [bacterium]
MRGDGYYVYIMTNRPRGTLYIGVTNEIFRRAAEHRAGEGSQFARKYKLRKLVYYEHYANVDDAIAREKLLKHWYRAWKLELIERSNPHWDDLFDEFLE